MVLGKKIKEVLLQYWVVTFTARTCHTCAVRHGKVYEFDADIDMLLPAHPRCRCSLEPMRSFARKTGKNVV